MQKKKKKKIRFFFSKYKMANPREELANDLNFESIFNTEEYINNEENVKINSLKKILINL